MTEGHESVSERDALMRVGKLVEGLEDQADGIVSIADVIFDLDPSTKDVLAAANGLSKATWDVRHMLEARLDVLNELEGAQ